MQYSSLTSINVSANQADIRPLAINRGKMERILLFLIAGIGILGSAYMLAASSGMNNTPKFENVSYASLIPAFTEDDDVNERFKDYIKMEGTKKAGKEIIFSFNTNKREKGVRYVMEMGNEVRMIITTDNFPFVYDEPGKYLLELKKIDKGLISTIATKKIKVKK